MDLAMLGKEFSRGLIRAVAGESEDELSRGLSHLQAAEFIYERPAFPDPEYTFKHALTQEVAYGSLLRERRGANTPKAVKYLHLAREQAVQHSSYTEALGQLSRAVELLEKLPDSHELKELEPVLQITRGQALAVTRGNTSALCFLINDTSQEELHYRRGPRWPIVSRGFPRWLPDAVQDLPGEGHLGRAGLGLVRPRRKAISRRCKSDS
jgi:hypothetical protein